MEKTLTALKITLLVLLIAVLVGVLVISINKDFSFASKFESKSKLVYDENIEEEFSKIDFYSESMDIEFVKSKDDKVNVKVYDSKENTTTVNVENDTLKIDSDKKEKCFFCIVGNRKTVIALPEKIYDLAIESKSGDILSNINFNKVSIDSKSGDIKLNSIKEGNLKVLSGDIDIEEVDDIEIVSASGDVEINKINKHLDIDTKSGDIFIKDLTLTNNSNIKVASGDVTIYNASEDIYFNTKAVSGDVSINNNNRRANNELTIDTKSGDITVRN